MARAIGLTGSFGSGKSAAAAMFAERGVPTADADRFAREAVAPGTEGLAEIVREFGPEMLNGAGELDREKMARLVFQDASARRKLNAIVHPRVREAMGRFVAEHAEAPMVVLEIPLLLESEDRAPVDEVVVVTASERARFGRLKRRGLSERRIVERLGSQMPQAKKVELADARIENDGDLEALRERIADFLSARQGAPAPSAAGR